MKPGVARGLAWTLVIAVLAVAGALLLFTRFMLYDDEGYVLWSMRGFCAGAPLYSEVYSQYGPLFYLFYRGLHEATGLVFDNDNARLLNLDYWLGSAALAGLVAQALTRRLAAGLIAAVLTFFTLISNINEPFHPGALLALLVAVAGAAGAGLIGTPRERHLGWILALVATAACLIKINVGVFLFAALGSWLWLDSRGSPALRRLAPGLVAAGLVAAPLALMRAHLGETSIQAGALVFACGGLALLLERQRDRRPVFDWLDWTRAAGASLALGGLVVACMLKLGTTGADLLEGVILGPLRHPGVYVLPPLFPGPAVLLAPLAVLGAIWFARRPPDARSDRILALAKLAAGLAFFAQAGGAPPGLALDRFAYYFGPALAWILVAPLSQTPASATRRARWIAWIFIWQTLQAFPVAGSQVAWGSFWWVPLCVYGWFQGAAHFAGERRRLRHLATAGAAGAAAFALGQGLWNGYICLQDSTRLDLPGARWVRPPPDSAATLRIVTRNLNLHAGAVFSLPGMFSLNIWSEKPTPTPANVTHWFSLLNETRQNEIAARLDAEPTALVVVQRDLIRFLLEHGNRPAGPLQAHLLEHFVPLARIDGYDLWGHPGRKLDVVDTFTASPDGVVSVTDPLPRQPRAAVLLVPDSPGLRLPREPAEPAALPGLERHFFALPGLVAARLPASARLVLLDSEGRELARLRPNLAPVLTAAARPAAD
jgi:hypothetical protein